MVQTIVMPEFSYEAEGAGARAGALWVPLDELAPATGWEIKPEGACRGEVCVPLPAGAGWVVEGRFNLSALAAHLGQPVLHDAATGTWAFGESAGARRESLLSLQAPDFTLPDLEGKQHSLSDYRGRKVFLASWASW